MGKLAIVRRSLGVVAAIGILSLTAFGAAASDLGPMGQGMPVPWPFPWAVECPVHWESMAGNYVLSDTDNSQYLDISITIVYRNGLRIVRVTRYNEYGDLVSSGFAYLTESSRSISLQMTPVNRDDPMVRATIRLYYQGNIKTCEQDNLVPILSLSVEHKFEIDTQYRLIRIGINRK